jgi:hypothetical protein
MLPALPMLRIEPALPILRMLPLLPMLRIEPKLPTLRIEPALATLSTLNALRTEERLRKLRPLCTRMPSLRLLLGSLPWRDRAARSTPRRPSRADLADAQQQ